MSAYTSVNTEFTDLECLVAALREMGYQPLVYDAPQCLEGYQGDRRAQTAEIIIPRRQVGGGSNDVGFKLQEDGTYQAVISQYDRGSTFTREKLEELREQYNVQKSLKVCRERGLKVIGQERRQEKNRWVTRIRAVPIKHQ